MPLPLLVLALSAFAIGTTEFVIMGLLPDVAGDLAVSIPSAGWLVSGYAFGVAIGAPIMALLTARLPRKTALLMLMGIFIIGNLLCAVAANYGLPQRNLGTVSVVGPTRMDYRRAIATVREAAHQLSRFIEDVYEES